MPCLVDHFSPFILEESVEVFSDFYESYWRHGTCNGTPSTVASTLNVDISDTRRMIYLTCFRLACLHDRVDLLQYLQRHKAEEHEDIGQEEMIQECLQDCLYLAIVHGRINVGRFLIEQGLVSVSEPIYRPPAMPLHTAISSLPSCNQELDFVRLLLERGADVHEKNHQGDAALHVACQANSVEAVRLLVEGYGADIHAPNDVCRSALFLASAYGRTAVCRYLLENGADVHDQEESVLYVACERGYLDIVCVLMDYRPDPWVRCGGLQTSAEVAVNTGNLELIKCVLRYDVGVKRRLAMDRTLLHCAARIDRPDILRWLLEKGYDPNTVDLDNMTAAHFLCRGVGSAQADHALACLQILNEFGATFTQYDSGGRLPIHVLAASHGHVYPFLVLGIDPNARTRSAGLTPLHVLCASGKCTSLEVNRLLDQGADVNAESTSGKTPIMESVLSCPIEIIDLLVESGADVLQTDLEGCNALHHMCRTQLKSLSGNAEEHESLFRSFLQRIFVPRNGDVNQGSRLGLTALHFAVFHSRRDQVEHLLEFGADMNRLDLLGRPPLHFVGRTFCPKDGSETDVFEKGLQGSREQVDDDILEVMDQTRAACYQTLLSRGADTTVLGVDGNRSFFLAASTGWLSATFEMLHASAVHGLFETRNHSRTTEIRRRNNPSNDKGRSRSTSYI